MKNRVLNTVARRNKIIEKVCSVRFAWYPKYRRKSWIKKKNTIVVNSSSHMAGGKTRAPPITIGAIKSAVCLTFVNGDKCKEN